MNVLLNGFLRFVIIGLKIGVEVTIGFANAKLRSARTRILW